jgi:hypothetical protein
MKIKLRVHSVMQKGIHSLALSIKLFKEKEYDGAILTAGAAEEIFNRNLEKDNKASAFIKIKNGLSLMTGEDNKIINDKINKVKNWLKHGTSEYLAYDEKAEAMQYIARAICAYSKIFHKIEPLHRDFYSLMKIDFPEMNEKIDEYNKKKTENNRMKFPS